jgi:thiosulfate sulfurtransferase
MPYTRIGIEQARELIEKRNAHVIDVRDPASYQAGHIRDAESINDANVAAFIKGADLKRPLIVCCYHGNMSQSAADYLSRQGFEETYSLDGGYEAWKLHP